MCARAGNTSKVSARMVDKEIVCQQEMNTRVKSSRYINTYIYVCACACIRACLYSRDDVCNTRADVCTHTLLMLFRACARIVCSFKG